MRNFLISASLAVFVTASHAANTTTAIEYYHSDFDHYFVTAYPAEAAVLDVAGVPGGWARTGQSYAVYPDAGAGLLPVCRFWSTAFAPKSSHFYTAEPAECALVKANNAWIYEADAFFVSQPAFGACSPGTAPLYRLYNNGQGGAPNHRYTTCANIRDRMAAKGWIFEGATMCVAAGSSDCSTDASAVAVPGAPTALVATAGNAAVSIAFAAPASGGGLPIIGYTASCAAAGVARLATGPASPLIVTGLANGIAHACTVFAANSVGNGPVSATTVFATPIAASTPGFNPLWIPPLLAPNAASGTPTYELALAASSRQFLPGPATATYGYNGNAFLGPTVVMNKGDLVRMQVQNALPEDTTTHWHGLLVSGATDGGPHSVIAAGATWLTDAFTVRNNAATLWYHPHMHEMTQKQVTLGAAGLIVIRDAEEAALALPRTYGTDDVPLAFTSRRFASIDGVENQLQYMATAYGDYVLTNGVMNAEVTLPKQMVRLRILNGEIERGYNLGFADGRTFHVIGSDGGLLAAPTAVTRLIVTPGERYEILVDLGGDAVGSSLEMQSYNGPDSGLAFGFAGFEDATDGEFGSLLNHRTFTVLRVNVGPATAGAVTALPAVLAANPGLSELTAASAAQTRMIGVTGGGAAGPFTFNGLPYDMHRIDQYVTLGANEAWTIAAGAVFSHAFHIHGVQFRVVARRGSASNVNPWEQGWKDTIYLPIKENVTFVARFDEGADAAHPFMYHCHMINHEDEGMMGQLTVR